MKWLFLVFFLLSSQVDAFEFTYKEDKNVLSFFDKLQRPIQSVVSIVIKNSSGRILGFGSGVIVSKDGYIVTNEHVVSRASSIEVYRYNDYTPYKAKLIGVDAANDLAVIKISQKNLPYIIFADSRQLKLTDVVFAIGNGFGLGTNVSQGIISAVNKRSVGLYEYENLIQTDATINPGNSGGALVNSLGHLVGINSAIYSRSGGSNGIGFAIPSYTVSIICKSIIEKGTFERGYFGASFTFDNNKVIIDSIDNGSNAFKAGLREGDTILSINNQPIRITGDLIYILGLTSPYKRINVKYIHNGKGHQKIFKLGKRP